MSHRDNTIVVSTSDQLLQAGTRRRFLQLMATGGAVVLLPSVFTACGKDSGTSPGTGGTFSLDLSNDTGILNYAYALEQLEAAYYTAVLTSAGFPALSAAEKEVLEDLQKHEVIHREFFKTVLGNNKIGTIAFNATTVGTLTASRAVILSTSQLLEDTGVSAYNGAGKYLTSATNLLLAGKIVSVEARHAAAIRDIRDTTGRAFAGDDAVDSAGLDVKNEPGPVLAAVVSLNVVTSPLAITTAPPTKPGTPNRPAPTPA